MNWSVPLASSAACAAPVRACAVDGRTDRTSSRIFCSDTPGFAATAISSRRPGLPKMRCAVSRSKPESVAPPSEPELPKRTRPAIVNRSTGPSACTPIVSPTTRCFLPAVCESITTCCPCGQLPETSARGLNGESGFSMLNPRFGAPPNTIAFPFLPIRCASPLTSPSATSTPGRSRIVGRSDAGSVGTSEPLFPLVPVADLPVTITSDPFRASVKIEPNALSIESVRT